MSNDPRFVISDPNNPGEIGATNPAPATFTHIQVNQDPDYQEGVRIVVATPSVDATPKGALYIQVASSLDPNPAMLVSNNGTGPGIAFTGTGTGPLIELATGVSLSVSAGQMVLTDTVAGSVFLDDLVGGGGGGESLTQGAISVNALISANTTVTASNTTMLAGYSTGLIPYADAAEFVGSMLVYVDGQLMASGTSAASNNDVYPAGVAASGQMAFEFDLPAGTVLRIVRVA